VGNNQIPTLTFSHQTDTINLGGPSMQAQKIVHPDGKGRIALGVLAKGVSSFHVTVDEKNRIILEPYVEIPAREKWLFENSAALESVRSGLKQSASGEVTSRGSFADYVDDESED
jgi:hypothetical protein